MSPKALNDRRSRSEAALTVGLAVFGAYHAALGALMVIDPGTFFTEIGPFGERNDHYIRDAATYNLALALALLVAARFRSWRVPVLVLVLVQFALHSVNHLVDIDEAEPSSIGVVDFVSLAIGTALLAGLLALATRRQATEDNAPDARAEVV